MIYIELLIISVVCSLAVFGLLGFLCCSLYFGFSLFWLFWFLYGTLGSPFA